jgi:hypothetical protein
MDARRRERGSDQRGLAVATLLALLLALATAGFALRALVYVAPPPDVPPLRGVFSAEDAPRARALSERLARGILALQASDGGFDLGANGQYSYVIERVASSALATAALAALDEVWSPETFPAAAGEPPERSARLPGLPAALGRALDYLKKQQTETGTIGREEPKDHWSQVDGTTAAILAFSLAGRAEDEEALQAAARALLRFARAGLRNGWTRALGVMTADRLLRLEREDLLGGDVRALADWRQLRQQPSGLPQASDWNVAEALSRVVMGLVKGQDAFPGQVTLSCLQELPVWSGQSFDCQATWMQSWLVARSGSPEAAAWFGTLVAVLAEEAIEDDDTIHGGWYANTLCQSAASLLALLEGLESQVLSP